MAELIWSLLSEPYFGVKLALDFLMPFRCISTGKHRGGAILVFLPGMSDIVSLQKSLQTCGVPLHILPLHSALTSESKIIVNILLRK